MINKIVLCFIVTMSFWGCTKSDAPSKTESLAQSPVLPAQEPMLPAQEEQPAITQESPLSLEAMQRGGRKFIKVTAITDNITVDNMIFNRGNCQSTLFYFKYPIQLKFGDFFEAYTDGCNDIIEAIANTNKGDFVYTFQ